MAIHNMQHRLIKSQIESLPQELIVTALVTSLIAIDEEHLRQALAEASDDDLGTLIGYGIQEQRAREDAASYNGQSKDVL